MNVQFIISALLLLGHSTAFAFDGFTNVKVDFLFNPIVGQVSASRFMTFKIDGHSVIPSCVPAPNHATLCSAVYSDTDLSNGLVIDFLMTGLSHAVVNRVHGEYALYYDQTLIERRPFQMLTPFQKGITEQLKMGILELFFRGKM